MYKHDKFSDCVSTISAPSCPHASSLVLTLCDFRSDSIWICSRFLPSETKRVTWSSRCCHRCHRCRQSVCQQPNYRRLSVCSPRHDDDLDEADEDEDEGGAGHVGSEPGVHLPGVLQGGQNENMLTHTHTHTLLRVILRTANSVILILQRGFFFSSILFVPRQLKKMLKSQVLSFPQSNKVLNI